jgi:5-methyltetrahydrofolate--homocysteine methyltransferase
MTPGGVTVVAERINATRKRIGEALEKKDESRIKAEASKQTEAGADYIDVNAGRAGANEPEELCWLVDKVQEAVDTPLCLDSADPEALKAAFEHTKKTPLVNSINGDPKRIETIVPLVAEKGASVVALCMEEGGMPSGVADRMEIATRLAEAAQGAGIDMSRVYFDPCVLAASTSQDQPLIVLETVREIKKAWPETHVISGLSNISFGMPLRTLINRTYLVMMMAAGADAFIIDPTDANIRAAIAAAGVLTARDEFGMEFIMAARDDKIVG